MIVPALFSLLLAPGRLGGRRQRREAARARLVLEAVVSVRLRVMIDGVTRTLLMAMLLVPLAHASAGEEGEATPAPTPASTPELAPEETPVVPPPTPAPPPPEITPTPTHAPAPVEVVPEPAVLPPDAPRLFLDCELCDEKYMRKRVGFVVYVRDRADADVHALVTSRATGAGGLELTARFIGLGRFADMGEDVSTAFVSPLATEHDLRKELARVLRVGLARFAARTRVGRELDVSWASQTTPPTERDPWDHWVTTVAANGNSVGESSYTQSRAAASVSAARVTELWKIRSSAYLYLYETRFDLGDDTVVESFRRDVGGSALVGRSLGEHVTLGVRPSWSGSTYTNIRSQYAGSGVAEWSVFPYSESTRRALVFQYALRGERPFYYEETIFGKRDEVLFAESARGTLALTQPWGTVALAVSGSHYLHDISKASLVSQLSLDLRIARGLSLTVSGSFSVVRNQLFLAKGAATDEEILLRRRQLATNYNYSTLVGLSYTFGSIYTPVVNTRLE